jgi:hypothetical protein
VKWIVNNKHFDIHKTNSSFFINAAQNGNFDICKWLLEENPDIDVASNAYKIVFTNCVEDRLDVPIWITDTLMIPIDFTKNNHNMIKSAIEEKGARGITWIIEKNIDIYDTNEEGTIVKVKDLDKTHIFEECSVCSLNISDSMIGCKHCFCSTCIVQISLCSKKCPLCAEEFDVIHVPKN